MADHRFRVMGCRARLSVDDESAELLDDLVLAAHGHERRWTRFDDESEVSRMNQLAGTPVRVSAGTALLVDRARAAHLATGGWFDPLLLRELVAAGYGESFELIGAFGSSRLVVSGAEEASRRPSIVGAEVDHDRHIVTLPDGAAFDPGGIGKGLAADLLADQAVASGARWAIVDLGGDVRVEGENLEFGEFAVEVAHPDGGLICKVAMVSGAVATSGTGRRCWAGPSGDARHHLIDPHTGMSARSDLLSATVLAAECWWAEAVATAVVVAGRKRGAELLRDLGLPALTVDAQGAVGLHGPIEDYVL